MLEIASELQNTRFYQEVKAEGRLAGERSLILLLLNRSLGEISPEIETQIAALNIEQLEALGFALLDFSGFDDLRQWLQEPG
ncbi:MAG: DUF4351 domain-containing protein [Jaaginema sp. PMC 1079.18]|nr:DUF4351 domain-containing protein [Jaaginema sp. PMC 1080.18]MEC4851251.1 DUF4351 domain-containing protein [Jaaginema sp. PMC 1079.18]MEC4866414.1 DUF4351 domain-containing protein [Jaaginema sp. PMC 1078.18]